MFLLLNFPNGPRRGMYYAFLQRRQMVCTSLP
nr:MAG TPA: hypothetical protein [Caudoviricetes sp.]